MAIRELQQKAIGINYELGYFEFQLLGPWLTKSNDVKTGPSNLLPRDGVLLTTPGSPLSEPTLIRIDS